ncbi:hydroxyisourate hydrolase [Vibrio sp. WJH972]
MSQLSCHILDTASGMPAMGVDVELLRLNDSQCLARETTNDDGRAFFDTLHLCPGQYTLRFMVAPYCTTHFGEAFFPMIDIHFVVDGQRNYHIPLLLSPYSFSSYRGS